MTKRCRFPLRDPRFPLLWWSFFHFSLRHILSAILAQRTVARLDRMFQPTNQKDKRTKKHRREEQVVPPQVLCFLSCFLLTFLVELRFFCLGLCAIKGASQLQVLRQPAQPTHQGACDTYKHCTVARKSFSRTTVRVGMWTGARCAISWRPQASKDLPEA